MKDPLSVAASRRCLEAMRRISLRLDVLSEAHRSRYPGLISPCSDSKLAYELEMLIWLRRRFPFSYQAARWAVDDLIDADNEVEFYL